MSIKVSQLNKFFGSQHAVNNISFASDKGCVLGFLGPNGAGKSTTMKILSGYLSQHSGKVEICGIDMIENSFKAKQHIGYLPENNPLYTEMYVKEYLSFVADIHQIENKKERVNQVIKLTGLEPEQNKLIGQLSKGYRQRVGLAQAIIHEPSVLILDEPTSGLDPNQLIEIRSLIKELGKTKTVILSTHIMQEVEAICDKVIIINKGKIVANDSIENLYLKYNQKSLEPIFVQLTSISQH